MNREQVQCLILYTFDRERVQCLILLYAFDRERVQCLILLNAFDIYEQGASTVSDIVVCI